MEILLVDGDGDDAGRIARELEADGVRCVWADGFEQAVEHLEQRSFDAVVAEQSLGDHTGLEFVELARRTHPMLPVVIVTGVDSREVDDAALDAGAAAFLLKREARGDLLGRTLRYAVRDRLDRRPESDVRPGGKELTLQVALARGMTIREAAGAAGISERTAYRRMSDPVFQAQLAALRTELRERILSRTVDDLSNPE